MKYTSVRCFIDTNVLFYAFGESLGQKCQQSQVILNQLIENNRLYLSTQVMQELHWNLVKKAGVSIDTSKSILKALAKNNLIVNDLRIMYEAIEIQGNHQFSFWDSLIIASAINAKCRYLISEDLNHGQKVNGVEILNPYL